MDRTKQRRDFHKNKLSWIYKKKLKLKRTENQTRNEDTNNKLNTTATRIVVRNLPFEVKEEEVRTLYKKYGEIEKIILHGQSLAGCAFIDFKRIQDASKAIFNTNKKEFFGRTISSGWVLENSKLYKKTKNITETDNKNKPSSPSLKRKNTNQGKEHKSLTLPESNKPKRLKRKH
ncbi:polyadenylate-binding protein, cytoplasmic and nuclear-like [Polistes fuscatus]|uniref:polyadenylate-binding protein, cytoplasmic and nuclear-like n=1 Tax=Polistes fuscatus TaxID=30207 RepID=UPI001CA984B2|nr:polyadenylate-binding protein, cytoplasmic and nuclear-like [Polistes fuscatus]